MSNETRSVKERHDAGEELTDADVRELERGEVQEQAADDEHELETDTDSDGAAQFHENGDGTYTRESDGVVGRFTPAGFEPYE